MVNTKITRERARSHFQYGFWKYALLAVFAVFGWNLFYSVTAYRPPDDKKVDTYFVTYALSGDTTDALSDMAAPAFPDMEALNFLSISMSTDDDYYGNMQLSTYIGAQEGDVYVMTWERFQTYAASGVFLPLDSYIASGALDLRGIAPGKGEMTLADSDTGEAYEHGVYGVPADSLYGMMGLGVDNRGLWMGVTIYSGNKDNAVKMIDWLIETFQADPPEGIAETNDPSAPDATAVPSY